MSNFMKRSIALLLVLIVCVSSLPAVGFTASAASYVYNWGERGEVATSLSDSAVDFYLDNNTSYNELAAMSGSTNTSSVPSSALYKELKALMTNAHTHITSYEETKSLYQYTDCENGGGKISSFYSGKAIGPAWGEGGWNREHTWPNSKGLGSNDENDIMMLRPTSTSENSSRGNTAYGKSSGFYNPNNESNGAYDLRGDVARIFLYVYVRWGNTSYAWGKSGVMESREVLLEWMEADPVDTWELGRNDAVESITGTRNVFVDYPELCFIMFGEDIPLDMTTPSGACNHDNFDAGVTVAPTCTNEGYVLYTCQTAGCGRVRIDNKTAALGHNYVDDVCAKCGDVKKPAPTVLTELKNGDVVIIGAPAYNMALSANKVAIYYNEGVSYADGFDNITDAERFVVTVNSDGTYTFTSKTGDVLALANDHNSLNVSGTHKTWKLEAKSGATGIFYVKNVGRGNYLEWYASEGDWSTYYNGTLSDLFEISFYLDSEGGNNDNPGGGNQGGTTPDTPDTSCTHSYTAVIIAPTCTADGFTIFTCVLCSDKYTGDKTAAKGHSYSNDECTVCGAEKSSGPVTISFADVANRTKYSTSIQVWQQNGITVTNNKAGSTIDVGNYLNPLRCYANSEVIISYPGIVKLEINCAGVGSNYVNGWVAGAPSDATVTGNNNIITIEFASPVDSVVYSKLSAQSRANSITVYTSSGSSSTEPACEHSNFTFEGAISVSCTADGHTGKIRCLDCNEIISDGETISKLGHVWEDANCDAPKTCSVCQETEGDALGHDWLGDDSMKVCDRCGIVVFGEIDHSECEASGFKAFFNAIMNFFRSLFGMPKQCVCGKFYD